MGFGPSRELRFAVEGGELAALQWGSGAPAAVLLHGAGDNAAVWVGVAPLLHYPHVVALDLRGHGQTTAPAVFDEATLAADVEHVVRSLELGAVTVIGHSWGANLAVEIAVRAAIRVNWLVLVEGNVASYRDLYEGTEVIPPEPWPTQPAVEPIAASVLAELVAGLGSIERAVVLRRHRAHGDSMIHPTPAEGLERAIAAWSQPLSHLYRQLPPGLAVTIIRASDRADDARPLAHAAVTMHLDQLIAERPDFAVRSLPGGHAIPASQPAALAELINDLHHTVPDLR